MEKHYSEWNEVLYHVGFAAKDLQGARFAVLPGDPGRVRPLAEALGTNCSFVASHREYTSWLTDVGDIRTLVCSTGMGGPSVAICLEELARMGVTHVIRFGTTGAIQSFIELGDVVISQAAVRLDGTSYQYAPAEFPAIASFKVTSALELAARNNGANFHTGISVSTDTFWPGQERYDSFTGYVPDRFKGSLAEWRQLGALNYEMETSALFVAAQCLGLKAGAVCGVVAKRTEGEQIAPQSAYEESFSAMVKIVGGALRILAGSSIPTGA